MFSAQAEINTHLKYYLDLLVYVVSISELFKCCCLKLCNKCRLEFKFVRQYYKTSDVFHSFCLAHCNSLLLSVEFRKFL